jgi:hypothetical protein
MEHLAISKSLATLQKTYHIKSAFVNGFSARLLIDLLYRIDRRRIGGV